MRTFLCVYSIQIKQMVELSETFFILLITGGFAFMGLSVRYALKSKCDKVECLCLKIHRNTDEELPDVEQPPSPNARRDTPHFSSI